MGGPTERISRGNHGYAKKKRRQGAGDISKYAPRSNQFSFLHLLDELRGKGNLWDNRLAFFSGVFNVKNVMDEVYLAIAGV